MSRWPRLLQHHIQLELPPVPTFMPMASYDVPMTHWLRKKNFSVICGHHQEVETCSATAPLRDNTEGRGEGKSSSGRHVSSMQSKKRQRCGSTSIPEVLQVIWLDSQRLESWKFWKLPSMKAWAQGSLGESMRMNLSDWDICDSGKFHQRAPTAEETLNNQVNKMT